MKPELDIGTKIILLKNINHYEDTFSKENTIGLTATITGFKLDPNFMLMDVEYSDGTIEDRLPRLFSYEYIVLGKKRLTKKSKKYIKLLYGPNKGG
jgi:hypothetical protein